ncbi:hypothetical protein ACQQ9V_10475, partial [Hornefia butyriciproducens]|uniref:hypothetical protein n=1 Tax=Hornefia butyriciproducens TaxID=2652293 RepID=UPI003CFD84B3
STGIFTKKLIYQLSFAFSEQNHGVFEGKYQKKKSRAETRGFLYSMAFRAFFTQPLTSILRTRHGSRGQNECH